VAIKLSDYKLAFFAVGLIVILLFTSSTVLQAVQFPSGEKFSELYLLGPQELAQDLPFNIVSGEKYTVHLGIGNHLGASTYYCCYLKIRNQTEPIANKTTPSTLTPLYTYRTVLKNNTNWTVPLDFSFSELTISNKQSTLKILTINNTSFNVNKIAEFNQENNGYYYQIFVELWALSSTTGLSEYQNRSVYFWLNATSKGSI